VLSVAAMLTGTAHVHSHDAIASGATGAGTAAADGHVHDHGAAGSGAAAPGTTAAATPGTQHVHAAADPTAWPRPWDPTKPIDFSGVPGVTPEQQARAQTLAANTLADLPQFSDVTKIGALGFKSIGDAASGFEHYINYAYIRDDSFLDPNKPESLVYQVDGDKRTLVSAMFMAKGMSATDPQLLDYGGSLMTWHVHEDLCWSLDANHQPIVVGFKDAAGNCPAGSVNAGGGVPMVHVWITPNECGPFAALEGEGAGQTAAGTTRTDQCASHNHGSSGG
jgi:hypothetical protein